MTSSSRHFSFSLKLIKKNVDRNVLDFLSTNPVLFFCMRRTTSGQTAIYLLKCVKMLNEHFFLKAPDLLSTNLVLFCVCNEPPLVYPPPYRAYTLLPRVRHLHCKVYDFCTTFMTTIINVFLGGLVHLLPLLSMSLLL